VNSRRARPGAAARLADVLVVPHMPVDGRHDAEVDHPALARLLR
jgi:hypothetical protein